MLGPGRYMLGVAELLLLFGSAWLGGTAVRAWLAPRLAGPPAHLASALIALALLIWSAELLGSFGAWDPVPFLVLVAVVGVGLWRFVPQSAGEGGPPRPTGQVGVRGTSLLTWVALAVAVIALLHFAWEAKPQLSTGMTGFDSTWYHGPFAAGFFQGGDTWNLHFIAPQFLAWFYPANGEIFHAAGMLAFGRDVLSPLLNVGWFAGCLLACWCIGRPYGVAPWSLALGAIALSVPALSDQAGEARNDVVGIFFLLAAIAIALAAWGRDGGELVPPTQEEGAQPREAHAAARVSRPLGPVLVVGLAAGLAAGTKLNFLLPAVVLVVGVGLLQPTRGSFRSPEGQKEPRVGWMPFAAALLAALAGGGYWYLRNLAHAGNPLPWVEGLGPISFPAPDQALGGREAHSVAGYLLDGSIWSDWFLPGLHAGLWLLWPLLLVAALAGLVLCLHPPRACLRGSFSSPGAKREPRHGGAGRDDDAADRGGGADRAPALAGLVGLATALAWILAPTSASGPDGLPRGFESGLRYLAPALVLGLALLPATPLLRNRLARLAGSAGAAGRQPSLYVAHRATSSGGRVTGLSGKWVVAGVAALVCLAALAGYPLQRHYLEGRYADPSFTAPGLNAAFAWARDVSDARIATTSTRQYPLFGTDLSNRVQFLGQERPRGGFEPPPTCPTYRRLLNEGDYDYVVATRDRLEPNKPPYPPQATWTESPRATVILRKPPTVIFKLTGPLDPSACP